MCLGVVYAEHRQCMAGVNMITADYECITYLEESFLTAEDSHLKESDTICR